MESIMGKFDLEFDAQALKTATREARRKQAMDLLQIATTAGMDMATGQYFVNMRNLWKYTLDTFEMSSEEIILTEKQVIKKQFGIEETRQQFQQKSQQQKYGGEFQPNAQQASGGIQPVEAE